MKLIKSLVLSLMIVATLMSSRSSQAVVGAFASAPAVVAAGVVTIKAAGGAFIGSIATAYILDTVTKIDQEKIGIGFVLVSMGLAAVAVVGLVILDGEQHLTYQEISPEAAAKLNISESERVSFNAEIDQVNALNSQVTEELAALENATLADSQTAWMEASKSLSAETFSAMQKVTLQLFK